MEDRIALGTNVDSPSALKFAGGGSDYESVSDALGGLDASGTIDRQEFLGLDDPSQDRFFTNSFDTRTEGVDIVGNINFELRGGSSTVTIALNCNKTEVTGAGTINPISGGRIEALKNLLPNIKGNVACSHSQKKWTTLLRAKYCGDYTSTGNGYELDAAIVVDAQIADHLTDNLELVAGLENLFDEYPDETPNPGRSWATVSRVQPIRLQQRCLYVQGRYSL